MNRGRPRHDDVLTPREWDVLACIREGLTNEEIAERLGISPNTVKYHVSDILGKLDVSSREQAAAWQGKPKVAFGFGLPVLLGHSASVSPLKLVGFGAITAAIVGLVLLALGVLLSNGDASMGKIAFVRDGNIWVQELPDGTPYQLTDKGASSSPQWSPSGEWLLYTANPVRNDRGYIEQYVVRADGTDERSFDTEAFITGWLPGEDDRLWFYGEDGTIATEDVDGSSHEVLDVPLPTTAPGVQRHRLPSFNDENLVFYIEVRFPEGADLDADTDEAIYYGIWVSNPDRTDARPLAETNPRDDERIFPMAWSLDNSHFLYATLPTLAAVEATGDSDNFADTVVYTVAIDGGTPNKLFETSLFGGRSSQDPEGTGTAIGIGLGMDSWTNKRIAVIAPDASGITFLTSPEVAAISPAWSLDGTQIAYVAGPDLGPDERDDALNARRLWVMNAGGSNPHQLTFGENVRDEAPMWSADGNHILFARLTAGVYCDGDRYELMLHSLEDASTTMLNNHLSMSSWAPDRDNPGFVSLCDTNSTPYQRDPDGNANVQQYLDWWQPQAN